jgi:flagellar biosynthetic protein FliR
VSGVEQSLFAGFLVFCRLAACFMTLPGFSSQRLPTRGRLMLAIGASLLIAPVVATGAAPPPADVPGQAAAILRESAIGAALGLLVRFYFLAFEMMVATMSTAIGLSAAFAPPVEGEGMAPPLAGVMTLAATMAFFASGLDAQAIRALAGSYQAFPQGRAFPVGMSLGLMLDTLQQASLVGLQIAAPILALAIAVNVAAGLLSRFMPQAPVYFLITPLLIGAGFLVLFMTERPMYGLFLDALAKRIATL